MAGLQERRRLEAKRSRVARMLSLWCRLHTTAMHTLTPVQTLPRRLPPSLAATGAAQQRRLCDELLRTLLDAPDANLDACDHLGMAPLGNLLSGALERQLIASRDMIDYGEPLWQVGAGRRGGWMTAGRGGWDEGGVVG